MRKIESKSYEAGGATMKLSLVETGKELPFRVLCDTDASGKQARGTLAAVSDEETAREHFVFHTEAAEKAGWGITVRGLKIMPGVPPPPSSEGAVRSSAAPATMKRKPGRPRKAA